MLKAPPPPAVQNRLLAALHADDLAWLAPHLVPVSVAKGEVLVDQERPVAHAWFIENGLGSVMARTPDGHATEIGMFGSEGLGCVSALLSAEVSEHCVMGQVDGAALRIEAAALHEAMAGRPAIHALMLRYVRYFIVQLGQTAAVSASYDVEIRLARWLLMAHDRLEDDCLPLTHEHLALMLGVQRSTLTVVVGALAHGGLVSPKRGRIEICDRAGLERLAGAAYGVPEAVYERLLGRRSRIA